MSELLRSPLFALALTLGCFELASLLQRRAGGHPLMNPVLLGSALIALTLRWLRLDFATYFAGARPLHLLLGPAIVALAVPLSQQLRLVGRRLVPLLAALAVGSVTAVVIACGAAELLGAGREGLAALAPKSVTTPIAMTLAERLGGSPTLAAGLVVVTGVLGATVGPLLLTWVRVRRPEARGFTLGLVAHGIGTASALGEGAVAGAFAGLAMGFNGLLTALWLPSVWHLFG